MKTLKITAEVHHELLKIKAEVNAKTLSEVIDFLICYRNRVIIHHEEIINDK